MKRAALFGGLKYGKLATLPDSVSPYTYSYIDIGTFNNTLYVIRGDITALNTTPVTSIRRIQALNSNLSITTTTTVLSASIQVSLNSYALWGGLTEFSNELYYVLRTEGSPGAATSCGFYKGISPQTTLTAPPIVCTTIRSIFSVGTSLYGLADNKVIEITPTATDDVVTDFGSHLAMAVLDNDLYGIRVDANDSTNYLLQKVDAAGFIAGTSSFTTVGDMPSSFSMEARRSGMAFRKGQLYVLNLRDIWRINSNSPNSVSP